MLNSTEVTSAHQERHFARSVVRGSLWLSDHWVTVCIILLGIFVITPFLAPVFMALGWTGLGQAIYFAYSMLCHQMAQRSFFLFGPHPMYNIAQLPVAMTGDDVTNTFALRNFIGNADLGWKVAWSDRMVYMFGATWIAAMIFGILRQRRVIAPLRIPLFILLLLPMAIDGGTHFLSDFSGGLLGEFRYSNPWLADLTGHAFPSWFYVGDALGSFNSWMRLFSGICFGVAVVWLAFPYLDRSFRESASQLRMKLAGQRTEHD